MSSTPTESGDNIVKTQSRRFFFPDGNIVFSVRTNLPHRTYSYSNRQVEDTLYKVHRHFFESYSEIFADMFSLPTADGEQPEGQSDRNPIVLEDVKQQDFECFLSVMYPSYVSQNRKQDSKYNYHHSDFSKSDSQTVDDWTGVLCLASRWEFTSIRLLAINQLTMIASPIERITRGVAYNVKNWLLPAYTELCTRDDPLNLEEGLKLGIRDVIFIGQLRSSIRRESGFRYNFEQIIAEELESHVPSPERL